MLSAKQVGEIISKIPATDYREDEFPVFIPKFADLNVVSYGHLHYWVWLGIPGTKITLSVESTGDKIADGDQDLFYFDRKTLKLFVNDKQVPIRTILGEKSQYPLSFHPDTAVKVAGLDMALRAS